MDSDLSRQIAGALRRLPLQESASLKFEAYVSGITAIAGTAQGAGYALNFRKSSIRNAIKEIRRLRAGAKRLRKLCSGDSSERLAIKAVSDLRETVQLLHETTIAILFESGLDAGTRIALRDMSPATFQQMLPQLDTAVNAAGRALSAKAELEAGVAGMPTADVGGEKGRLKQQPAAILGCLLFRAYHALVGSEPTITVRPERSNSQAAGFFVELVSEVLGIAGIKANAEAVARAAIEECHATAP